MTVRKSLVLVVVQFLLPVAVWCQNTQEKADLLITGGTVVTMNGPRTIYDDGAVIIKGDTIVAVGPGSELEAKYQASQTIDARASSCSPDSSMAIPTFL